MAQAKQENDVLGDVIVGLFRGLAFLVWWLVRRPALLAVLLLLGGLHWLRGWPGVGAGAFGLVASAALLGLLWPAMFRRLLVYPWRRARVRRRYRRRWAHALDLCGLTKSRGDQSYVPRLRTVQVGTVRDRLLVHLVMGQSIRDYERACLELATAFGAQSARVFADCPGRVWLELVQADALAAVVPALPIPATPDLTAVQIGVREDGEPWVLSVLGTHVFVAGETGSGKGSVIWSVLRALAVPVRSGLVAVWAVDPKGGMELGFGRPMFSRFAHESTEAMVLLLEEAVRVMDARCRNLLGRSRLHTSTEAEPLILLVIDELASLTAYETDTKLRARATAAISALLSRGRAAAVVVLAAAQDPRKEVVSFRSLFPTKVALRLDTPTQWTWCSETDACDGRCGRSDPELVAGCGVRDGGGRTRADAGPRGLGVGRRYPARGCPVPGADPDGRRRPGAQRVPGVRGRPGAAGCGMTGALLAGSGVSPSAAVVVATARAMAERNGVEERTAREAARRVLSGDYRRWQAQTRGAGFCSRPVRVSGGRSVLGADGRREVYCTDGEPDRVLLIRCGNRRASVCAPCSREYKGDVWHLLHAGTAGGSKGMPESVAAHPMWFVTLTGPGFGAVHGAGCGRGGTGRSASGDRACSAQVTCVHGRPRVCGLVHGQDDPVLAEALCPDCYDYPGSVAFNWAVPELWRRFTIALRRRLAGRLGISEAELGRRARVSYAKVAEFQRRGVVHFHAIIRLDGVGDGHPPARIGLSEPEIAVVIRAAVGDVAVTAPTSSGTSALLRFGAQVDVRAIAPAGGADDAGEVSAGMVAAYIAKYATKAAEDFGLDSTVRTSSMARAVGLRTHTVAMILAAEELAGLEYYAGMARWLHMLGFRGHFTTKSRQFSVTLGALRQARRDFRAAHRQPAEPVDGQVLDVSGSDRAPATPCTHAVPASATEPGVPDDGDTSKATEVVGNWRFLGLGYTTAGDALLAAHAYADHLVDRSLAREAVRQ